MKKYYLFWLLSILGMGNSMAQSGRTQDSLELVNLYISTDSINWTTRWRLSQPMNDWHGITLDLNGRVTAITLYNNNLRGLMPNLNLPNLQQLSLSWNQLSGAIPNFNLPNLRILYLEGNQLSGTIPNFNLPNLRELHLHGMQLSGTIPNFNLPNLYSLQLSSNQLSGTIPNFSLPNLVSLQLSNNRLSDTIPNFNLPNIYYLYLNSNQLIGSVPNFNLPNLTFLYLSSNQLSGILPSLSNLPRLHYLDIQNNKFLFSDLIPNLPFIRAPGSKSYAPQLPVFRDTALLRVTGGQLNISLEIDSTLTSNRYQWYKNGSLYGSPVTHNRLIINRLLSSDAGTYTCQVTNPNLPQLTLSSRNIVLQVSCNPVVQETQRFTLCAGQTRQLASGRIVNAVGTYQDTLRSAWDANCDSVRYSITISNDNSCRCQDSIQLVSLYNATNGAGWTNRNNWLSSSSIENWYGIRTNAQGCVISMDLRRNLLAGNIPNFNLPQLSFLQLEANQLSGSIPNFNQLPNLTYLALDYNQLSGNIPDFRFLNLTDLYLHSNQLTGNIPNLTLPNLQHLYLNNNQLSGCIPAGIKTNCPSIGANNGNISNNPSLSTQNWANYWNNGTGACLTARVDTITALQCGTRTYRLPSGRIVNSIGTYVDTSRGITQDTFFTVRLLADNTCRCTDSLVLVDLYNATGGANWYRNTDWLTINPINTWHGISVDAQGCVSHIILGSNADGSDTTSNHLVGTLPASLGNLANLQYLCLPNSALRGAIPATFGQLSNLIKLSLYSNQLDSSLPSSLSGMSRLRQLWLANNQLSGNIPSNLGNLTNLTQLYLRNNQFNGTIPKELGRLTQLIYFNLSHNRLTGNIPDSLGNLTQLQQLFNVGNNYLTGAIPTSLGNLAKVQQISLYGNQLTGSLPTTFQRLDSLKYLYVFSNKIDSLPNLSGLSQLTIFQADTNKLTFDDILPNLPKGITYKMQDSIFKDITYFKSVGSPFKINLDKDGALTSNEYKWYKNGQLHHVSNVNYLNFNSLTLSDAGSYKCVVTNPNAPNLSLLTGNAQVQVYVSCPPPIRVALQQSICQGSFYQLPSGRKVTVAGSYSDTLRSILGCDSLITGLSLIVNPLRYNTIVSPTRQICQGNSTIINGQQVFTSGNYTEYDTVNCVVTIRTIPVVVIPQLTISTNILQHPTSCSPNGIVQVLLSGGLVGYNYPVLWSNGYTNLTVNHLAADTYTVTVTDHPACNQPLSASVTLIAPPALTATVSPTNVACFGQNNGSAAVAPVGVLPYRYLWTNNKITSSIDTLIAGTYTVTITDAQPCTIVKTFIITQPIKIRKTVDTTICEGAHVRNHSITGIFRDTLRSFKGCDSIITLNLRVLPRVSISIDTIRSPTSCLANGSMRVNLLGGIAGYNYSILWSNGSTNQTINNLAGGPYSVIVTDNSICNQRLTASLTLTAPAALTDTFSQTNVTCYGRNDGTATANAVGGVLPYSYSWSNNQNTARIQNLQPNRLYSVTITDAQGCRLERAFVITQPTPIQKIIDTTICKGTRFRNFTTTGTFLDIVRTTGQCDTFLTIHLTVRTPIDSIRAIALQQPMSCVANGAVQVLITGGAIGSTYPIVWRNGATNATFSNLASMSNLASGTYYVTVMDSSVCRKEWIDSIKLTAPQALTATTAKRNVSCYGKNDGADTVNVLGGVPPYTYRWNNNQTTATINGLIPNIYSVTVTDAQPCTVTRIDTITQPNQILRTIDATICQGSHYSNFTNDTISGTFTHVLPSFTGCDSIVIVTLKVIPRISITTSVVKQPESCVPNGSVQVRLSGGVSGYNYPISWSNGDNTSIIRGLTGGTYSVTVTEHPVCHNPNRLITGSVPLLTPLALTADTTQTNIDCHGQSTGVATVTASGGLGPYTYLWSNGRADSSISNLASGTYRVTVTDSLRCTVVKIVTITDSPAIYIRIDTTICQGSNFRGRTTTDTFTYNECNKVFKVYLKVILHARITTDIIRHPFSCKDTGEIKVNLFDTVAGYRYRILWSNGDTTNRIRNLRSGTYTVTVIDTSVCHQPLMASVTLIAPPRLNADTAQTNVTCNGKNNGTAKITVSGGVPPYTYRWTGTSIPPTTDSISNLIAGTYTVTITDMQSCTLVKTFLIRQPDTIAEVRLYPTICEGDVYTLPNNDVVSTSGTYSRAMNTIPLGCPYVVTTYLTVHPKELTIQKIDCNSIRPDTNPSVETRFIYASGCTTKVITNTYTSSRILFIEKVCTPSELRPDIIIHGTTWRGCPIDTIKHYELMRKYDMLTDTIVARQDSAEEIKIINSTLNVYNCYDTLARKFKLTTRHETHVECNKSPWIDTIIQRHRTTNVNDSDFVLIKHHVFDTCACFKKVTIYNGLIINDMPDGKNDFLFVKNRNLYPPLELIITDKRGMLLFQSTKAEGTFKPFDNDWHGEDNRGHQLPEGIYNYILRIRHDGMKCVRMGVLGIKYIE